MARRVDVDEMEIRKASWETTMWKKAIQETGLECIYTDWSKNEEGCVGAAAYNDIRGEISKTYLGHLPEDRQGASREVEKEDWKDRG